MVPATSQLSARWLAATRMSRNLALRDAVGVDAFRPAGLEQPLDGALAGPDGPAHVAAVARAFGQGQRPAFPHGGHRSAHVPLDQHAGAVDLRRCGGDTHLYGGEFGDRRAERLPLHHVGDDVFEQALGDAEGGGAEVERDGGHVRQAVERGDIRPAPRLPAAAGKPERNRTVSRHERPVGNDGLGPGAGEPHHPPVVVDLDRAARHQAQAGFGRRAAGREHAAEQQPARVVATARESPAAGQPPAAVGRFVGAGGEEAGGDRRVQVVGPHLVGHARIHHPDNDRMVAVDAADPRSRGAAPGEGGDDADDRIERQFAAAEPPRLAHRVQAGRADVGHRLVGQAAQRLGLGGALGERRDQRFRAGEKVCSPRLFVFVHGVTCLVSRTGLISAPAGRPARNGPRGGWRGGESAAIPRRPGGICG